MSSTYTLYPSSVTDNAAARRDRMNEPRSLPLHDGTQHHISPSTPADGTLLSAHSPQLRLRSSSSSPALNTHTPAESISTLSINYQSSEFSEGDDPYFGVNFGALEGGSPIFLDQEFRSLGSSEALVDPFVSQPVDDAAHHVPQGVGYLPLSPGKTPSLPTASPNGEKRRAAFSSSRQPSSATRALNIVTQSSGSLGATHTAQFTPETSGSGRSSDDGNLAPAPAIMQAQSPRLTLSVWGRNGASAPYVIDTDQHPDTFSGASGGDTSYHQYAGRDASGFVPIRDGTGQWLRDDTTGQRGLGPEARPVEEGPSMNELAAKRKVEGRNQEVGEWVATTEHTPPQEHPAPRPRDIDDNLPDREIGLGSHTQNIMAPGQTYFTETGGELTQADIDLMRQNRGWGDSPLPFSIHDDRYQPETSQAAIEKFERLCTDNESIVSRAATWGTRRRSLPSIIDFEGVISGNLLKKLSLNRGNGPRERRPSILGNLRNIVKKQSSSPVPKRPRAGDDASSIETTSSGERNPSQISLAPPTRTASWGKKQSTVPSINTAFVAMGNNMASIGTAHARSGSVSATPIASPRSPGTFNLNVKRPLGGLGRMRSKSDLTKSQPSSSLADMWKQSGGPPVASFANTTSNAADLDDEDDEDDDAFEDSEIKTEANKIMVDITPNFAGFQEHILKLNPMLATRHNYLIDRMAHQQIVRYKSLLNSRVKHLQCIAVSNCACGTMCMSLGGSPNILDSKGDTRGLDPLSARYDGSDGDVTPLEGPGVIGPESFPQDIPMPPANILPAEFECQLCFQAKKFQKPSDWTKHVHEDVQPFTCTWDRCRDPKIFKRKADWVRHENEGHRHLEWWDCDVDECRHVCYRRDNFLQHLVREHKYPEPKVKTKAAIKRSGGLDPTWQKVEKCHKETKSLPQDEPCKFCGKTFPTWKKLTVHLAKHMEQISLPILKLVANKDLEPDTIISPVQDPPPRSFPATFTKTEAPSYDTSPMVSHPPMSRATHYSTTPQQQHHHQQQQQQQQQQQPFYSIVPQGYHPPLYGASYSDISPSISTNMGTTMSPSMNANMGTAMGTNMGPNIGAGMGPNMGVGMGAGMNTRMGNGMPTNMGAGPLSVQTGPQPINQAYSNVTNVQAYSNLPATTGSYIAAQQNPFVSMPPDVGHFPIDALGLQTPNMMYNNNNNNMMDPSSAGTEHFTPQGSVSPYSHSPHQPQGNFYQQ